MSWQLGQPPEYQTSEEPNANPPWPSVAQELQSSEPSHYHLFGNIRPPANPSPLRPDPQSSRPAAAPAAPPPPPPPTNGASSTQHHFDILAWHQPYQSCQRFFLDHGQHEEASNVLMAFLNIKLPHQFSRDPIFDSRGTSHVANNSSSSSSSAQPQQTGYYPRPAAPNTIHSLPQPPSISLHPYIRRLIATNFCKPSVLLGLFGSEWPDALSSVIEIERRNFLFAAKSVSWAEVKKSYDMDNGQLCPFLMPLEDCLEEEMVGAEGAWGRWLGMQDWMVGSRAPQGEERNGGSSGQAYRNRGH